MKGNLWVQESIYMIRTLNLFPLKYKRGKTQGTGIPRRL